MPPHDQRIHPTMTPFPCTRRVAALASAALVALSAFAPLAAGAQSTSGPAARAAARSWRERNEGGILTEFTELLALPNLATDSAGIRRNAAQLLAMLGRRG